MTNTEGAFNDSGSINFDPGSRGRAVIALQGDWKLSLGVPSPLDLRQKLQGEGVRQIQFDSQDLKEWDSGLLTYLLGVKDLCAEYEVSLDATGLPDGVRRLLALATAVPEVKDARKQAKSNSFFHMVGEGAITVWDSIYDMLEFLGETALAVVRMFTGRARFRLSDLMQFIQESGAQALPIVSLISVLAGLILAFVGAEQLATFGTQIYVADLVGLGMVREMGALMTAVIMAGRTGAAYAAQLGTMQVNEEIDALKTLGISPMDFLVLPRMLALIFMMPLLCVYANLLGMIGGALVTITMFDINLAEYLVQTRGAIDLGDLFVGLFKCGVFGMLIALSGCMRGMQCGRSASAVGDAATSSMVTAIVLIVVADAALTVVFTVLGI